MAEKGGLLSVATRCQDKFVMLEFADQGSEAAAPDHVFDPFHNTKPIGQGTGLGLSACYGVIQEHNGKIMRQNRPEGGVTFQIQLPIAKPATLTSPDPHNDNSDSSADLRATATLTLPPTP
jgi:C4-dicarboxylate-specific signal transduction histidine kinase